VFELLADPRGAAWRHKVGVAGPRDGSAKPSTRLFAAQGWVCKLQLDHACASVVEAREAVAALRGRGVHAGIWHPDKVWLVMRADGAWHPVTLCRELVTLRQLATCDERMRLWTTMLQLSIDVHCTHGLGLDLNPANFATEPGGSRLYYLDDELYDRLDARDLAGAIVARIPEANAPDPAPWQQWGAHLREQLALQSFTWPALRDEIALYPLPERYEPCRDALLAALATVPQPRRASGELTCVLADVHANAAALDAVIADARAHGAERFLFLGDAVGYGPDPAYCVRRLAELPRASLVRGNHDHAIATNQFELGMNSLARQCAEWTRSQLGTDELAWLAALPIEHVEEHWLAVHGAPRDPHRFFAYVYELTYEDNLRHLREHRIPLCFYGHTHVQLTHVELAAGPSKLAGERTLEVDPRRFWLVNPGSVGQPRDRDSRAAYALWRPSTGELRTLRVAYDVERTVGALRSAGLPGQLEHRLQAGA
jgi:diadenosine tetraphosphatase ApaH/serine/threonine PP2A family protein phosphatase